MTGILIFFHCGSNTGYAIGRHEYTFAKMAQRLVGDENNIHYGYPDITMGRSSSVPEAIGNVVTFNPSSTSSIHQQEIGEYVKQHDIRIAFGFDQPVKQPTFKALRKSGVSSLISYWGAPMSNVNHGAKLVAKKIDVALARYKPDHFVFQSEGMRQSAVNGRGIPMVHTSVVRSGVDIEVFKPCCTVSRYAHEQLNIEAERKIVCYSGHMEERKGVRVLLHAMKKIVEEVGRDDVHLLILGDKEGEKERYDEIVQGTKLQHFVTFGRYRSDVDKIFQSCYAGVIATTGWDSHTMSAVEMASCGLPVIVSDLCGLREAVTNETGLMFPVGDHDALARCIEYIVDNREIAARMGQAARKRVELQYTNEHQVQGLVDVVRKVSGKGSR